MTERVKRLVQAAMDERDLEYEAFFSGFVADEGARLAIKDRIAHLYRMKAEAGIIMSELAQAQSELERHLRGYSAEARDRYLDLEYSLRSKQEVENVAAYLGSSGINLSDAELERLRSAIQQHTAYTRATAMGAGSPYDEPLVPFRGRSIIPRFEALSRNLSAGSARVLSDKALQLSAETIAALERYYATELAAYEEEADKAAEVGLGKRSGSGSD